MNKLSVIAFNVRPGRITHGNIDEVGGQIIALLDFETDISLFEKKINKLIIDRNIDKYLFLWHEYPRIAERDYKDHLQLIKNDPRCVGVLFAKDGHHCNMREDDAKKQELQLNESFARDHQPKFCFISPIPMKGVYDENKEFLLKLSILLSESENRGTFATDVMEGDPVFSCGISRAHILENSICFIQQQQKSGFPDNEDIIFRNNLFKEASSETSTTLSSEHCCLSTCPVHNIKDSLAEILLEASRIELQSLLTEENAVLLEELQRAIEQLKACPFR